MNKVVVFFPSMWADLGIENWPEEEMDIICPLHFLKEASERGSSGFALTPSELDYYLGLGSKGYSLIKRKKNSYKDVYRISYIYIEDVVLLIDEKKSPISEDHRKKLMAQCVLKEL